MKHLALIAVVTFCMACGQPGSEFVGQWETKIALPAIFSSEQNEVHVTLTIKHSTGNQYYISVLGCGVDPKDKKTTCSEDDVKLVAIYKDGMLSPVNDMEQPFIIDKKRGVLIQGGQEYTRK